MLNNHRPGNQLPVWEASPTAQGTEYEIQPWSVPSPVLGTVSRRLPRRVIDCPLILGLAVFLLLVPAAVHAAPVTVTPADAPVIKKAIAAQHGHVVVVNFWATWCGPCVAEFPAIVRLSKRYKKRGLRVIAVSADQLKDRRTKVVPFLVKQKAKFPLYLQRGTDPEAFINAFDPTWQGELPHTLIYDRHGRRVKTLSGPQTAQSLAAAVRPYLAH